MCVSREFSLKRTHVLRMPFWMFPGARWNWKVRSLRSACFAGGLSATRRECLPEFAFVSFILWCQPRWPRNGFNDGIFLAGVRARVIGISRPVVLQSAEDAMPNIELGLVHNHNCFCACVGMIIGLAMQAPPLHAWPQVAAEIGQLTESRERMENANMDNLQQEFNKAEAEARRRIGNAIGRAMRVYDDPLLARSILVGRLACL